jgi:hypothetical protein
MGQDGMGCRIFENRPIPQWDRNFWDLFHGMGQFQNFIPWDDFFRPIPSHAKPWFKRFWRLLCYLWLTTHGSTTLCIQVWVGPSFFDPGPGRKMSLVPVPSWSWSYPGPGPIPILVISQFHPGPDPIVVLSPFLSKGELWSRSRSRTHFDYPYSMICPVF